MYTKHERSISNMEISYIDKTVHSLVLPIYFGPWCFFYSRQIKWGKFLVGAKGIFSFALVIFYILIVCFSHAILTGITLN